MFLQIPEKHMDKDWKTSQIKLPIHTAKYFWPKQIILKLSRFNTNTS